MRTIIKNGMLISMDINKDKYTYEDIVIEDDKIIFVGNNYDGVCDKEIDAKGKIVMPGLINCHTHLGMSVFRATNDIYSWSSWWNTLIKDGEAKMTEDDVYYSTLVSLIEMIKTGTTCFNDMYFDWRGSFRAFNKIGIRGVFGRHLACNNEDNGEESIKDFLDLYNSNNNELIKLAVAPHALYTTNMEFLKKCHNLADKYNLPVHIHLSESMDENSMDIDKYDMVPMEVLREAGILNDRVVLAHGTFISHRELDMVRGFNVSVCTNPVSNLNLGCGIADISRYMRKGVNVCLGTDGQGSGNNMNMFYHMSLLDNLQQGMYHDSNIMTSYDVLKIATINGAKALGMENEIGTIEVGKKADIIILDLNNICMTPMGDPIIQVVHNGWYNSVVTSIIDGNIMMEDRKLNLDIEIDSLKKKINEIRERIL